MDTEGTEDTASSTTEESAKIKNSNNSVPERRELSLFSLSNFLIAQFRHKGKNHGSLVARPVVRHLYNLLDHPISISTNVLPNTEWSHCCCGTSCTSCELSLRIQFRLLGERSAGLLWQWIQPPITFTLPSLATSHCHQDAA